MDNIIYAHAQVQSDLLMLMIYAAGGYHDLPNGSRDRPHPEALRRLSEDAQHVVDAAIQLKRVIVTGGTIEPPGVNE